MKIKLTAHNDLIVVEAIEPEKGIGKNWFPTGSGRIGCILGDSKKNLGASAEAIKLLRIIEVGHDSIGDVDWFLSGKQHVFGWLGPINRFIHAPSSVAARNFKVHEGQYIEIPNDVPKEATDILASTKLEDLSAAWRDPISIDVKEKK